MMGKIQETVRVLRKKQTESELIFWEIVRNRRSLGLMFNRQYGIQYVLDGKIRFFIADFYCHEKKLVIEIDGKLHENQKEYDEIRTSIINQLGIKVSRFKNENIKDINNIAELLRPYL
jgi:very-short-patch-repair endonuclease